MDQTRGRTTPPRQGDRLFATPSRRWHFSGRAAAPLRKRSFTDHVEKSSTCESGHSLVATGDHDTIKAERLHPKAAYSRCRPKPAIQVVPKQPDVEP
jgi:hypothetical protein